MTEKKSEGQVSETQRLDEDQKDTPIAPEDAVAGYPDGESDQPDEGAAGPNAIPTENARANHLRRKEG
jgi:hypothetical protein